MLSKWFSEFPRNRWRLIVSIVLILGCVINSSVIAQSATEQIKAGLSSSYHDWIESYDRKSLPKSVTDGIMEYEEKVLLRTTEQGSVLHEYLGKRRSELKAPQMKLSTALKKDQRTLDDVWQKSDPSRAATGVTRDHRISDIAIAGILISAHENITRTNLTDPAKASAFTKNVKSFIEELVGTETAAAKKLAEKANASFERSLKATTPNGQKSCIHQAIIQAASGHRNLRFGDQQTNSSISYRLDPQFKSKPKLEEVGIDDAEDSASFTEISEALVDRIKALGTTGVIDQTIAKFATTPKAEDGIPVSSSRVYSLTKNEESEDKTDDPAIKNTLKIVEKRKREEVDDETSSDDEGDEDENDVRDGKNPKKKLIDHSKITVPSAEE